MHTQLILLHSNLDKLKKNTATLMTFIHQPTNTQPTNIHTQVLLLNQTAAYADWLFTYLETFIIDMTADTDMPMNGNLPDNTPLTHLSLTSTETSTEQSKMRQISWFALKSDLDAMNPTAQQAVKTTLQRHDINLIDELMWVDLVNQADKVITISQ